MRSNMWQTLITFLIIGIALFFIGKKVYHLIRQAIDPSQKTSCGCGCSGCSVPNCSDKK